MEEYLAELGHPKPLSSEKLESRLRRRFPGLGKPDENNRFPIVESPAVFVDKNGAVLAWSLPDIIPVWMQVRQNLRISPKSLTSPRMHLKTRQPHLRPLLTASRFCVVERRGKRSGG